MFKAVVERASNLKPICDAIDHSFPFTFQVSNAGLVLEMLDDGHVWFFHMTFAPDFFLSFEGGSCRFAVASEELKLVLKNLPDDHRVELAYEPEEQRLTIISTADGSFLRKAQLPVQEPTGTPLDVPEADYPGRVDINVKQFSSMLKDIATGGSIPCVDLRINAQAFTVSGCTHSKSMEYVLTKEHQNVAVFGLEGISAVSQKFQIKLLLRAVKALESLDRITLYLRSGFPIRLEGSLETNTAFHALHYVCPQVDADDNII